MKWHELFPGDRQPSMDEIADYIGKSKNLWLSLTSYFETAYKAKPKLSYSGCSMPGWNVKYSKCGVSFGTLYPKEDFFQVMVIIANKLELQMESVLPLLTLQMADMYRNAEKWYQTGKYLIFNIDNEDILEDYKRIAAVKLPPKFLQN